jgi:hypothetical protein
MGMIPKEQVPPMLLINNTAIEKTQLPQFVAIVSGTAQTVTIDDIIAAEGARVPNASTAPKQFKVGFVLLTRSGDIPGTAPAAIEIFRNSWAGRLALFTQGVGSVNGANGIVPLISVYVDAPVNGATVSGPDVTVTGAVVSSIGAETGVTVNGINATLSGSRFVANHVPLQSGANSLSVTATDVNDLTAATTLSATQITGNYLRIVPNVTSGTAPLNISLRLNGSFIITNPTFTTSGPVPLALTTTDGTVYIGMIPFEGTYTVTASAAGTDGQQCSDTVTFTVLSTNQLQTLLQGKWNGIKGRISAKDINGIVAYLPIFLQAEYRDSLTSMGNSLSLLNDYMTPIEFSAVVGGRAKFFTYRTEHIQGQPVLLAFPIYFVQENGILETE